MDQASGDEQRFSIIVFDVWEKTEEIDVVVDTEFSGADLNHCIKSKSGLWDNARIKWKNITSLKPDLILEGIMHLSHTLAKIFSKHCLIKILSLLLSQYN